MNICGRIQARNKFVSTLSLAVFLLLFALSTAQQSSAIPAFARKYGLPCSACHEAWPKLNAFGQTFKDNGYQLMNDRDSPIYKDPSYWPIAMRITPQWHRENTNRVNTDQAATGVQSVSTSGFDYSGLDILTGGTIAKNISFLLVPSADSTASFHFESAWARFDNMFHSSWANLKFGKFELDNVISEKRILTLSNNGGYYQTYHFLPFGDANPNAFGLGDNQLGIEFMGHSKNSYSRYSIAVVSSTDGNDTTTLANGATNPPTGRTYDVSLNASQAFQAGKLGLQRVGVLGYLGQLPTYSLTTGGVPIPGTGIGNKSFYRSGVWGIFYVKKLDFTTMFTHNGESAYLATMTPAGQPLPAGSHDPTWNSAMIETHFTATPQLLFLNRYEVIRMTQQGNDANASNLGNVNALTFAMRWYPTMNSRAGIAIHPEFSRVTSKGTFGTGQDLTTSSAFIGVDFAF
jgi:hypothetical protein